MVKLTIFTLFGGLVTSSLFAAPQEVAFSLKEKLSYSLGMKTANNLNRELLQQELSTPELNLDMLLKGLVDGLLGSTPLLNETDLRSVILSFQKQKRHQESTLRELKMLAAMLSTYRLDTGEYPATLEELMTNSTHHQFWRGPYLEDASILKDPWGNSYQYHHPGHRSGMYYDLFSYAADGIEGGQEENADIFFQTGAGPYTYQETSSEAEPLQIHYQHDAWTRITDSQNQELFSGIGKSGEKVLVKGRPPFQLKFGLTQGVTIEYQGEKFLLEKHPGLKNGRIAVGKEK